MIKKSTTLKKFKTRNNRKKKTWSRILRYYWVRITRLEGTPKKIARGVACGVFAGSFPFFGLQTLMGVGLAIFLRGNKIAAAAATWISNPLTYIPIFAFNYQVGCRLLGVDRSIKDKMNLQTVSDVMILAKEQAKILTIGSAVVGLFLAIVTYFLSIKLIDRWRKSRQDNYYRKNKHISVDRNNNNFQNYLER